MIFGNKPLIAQYEAHIASLREEIRSLRSLVFPGNKGTPPQLLEADAILSGKNEHVEVSEEEMRQAEEENSERDRLLSGTY